MNLLQPLSHLVVKFVLEGNTYEVEHFKIAFHQPVDYKGQPQHETKGGQIQIVLTQAADNLLYDWAKRSNKLKNGVVLFQTDLGMTVSEVAFTNAYCVSLLRNIDEYCGMTTTLVISPDTVQLNGKTHYNNWKM